MRKFIILIIAVVVATITAVILYRYYTRTPKYSLWQAKKAFESHDRASFEKYVDVEGVCSSLIDQTDTALVASLSHSSIVDCDCRGILIMSSD